MIVLVRDDDVDETMSKYLVDRIRKAKNIEVRTRSRLVAVEGDDRVRAVMVADGARAETYRLPGR